MVVDAVVVTSVVTDVLVMTDCVPDSLGGEMSVHCDSAWCATVVCVFGV